MKFASIALAAALSAVFAAPALAQSVHGKGHAHAASNEAVDRAAPGAAHAMSEGTVKKVDKSAGKVTIAHGPLENLDMPPMTMVFRVTDEAMLDEVKAGDKIRFTADKVGGAYTVTALEAER